MNEFASINGLPADYFYGDDAIGRTIFGRITYGIAQSVKAAGQAAGSIVQGDLQGAGQAFKNLASNMKAEAASWKGGSAPTPTAPAPTTTNPFLPATTAPAPTAGNNNLLLWGAIGLGAYLLLS